MTKEEALKNLSLAPDADMEIIRSRFASRYTMSDEQYDLALTEGMKQTHEAHLRELETSYKVLTDSAVIKDMGALLSMGKGYIQEDEGIGGEKAIHPEEALAFFAVYPYQTPLLVEERYKSYLFELDAAIEASPLEASKEPYRQEKLRAEENLQVAVNYLISQELKAPVAPVEETETNVLDQVEEAYQRELQKESIESVAPDDFPLFTEPSKKDSKKMLVFIAVFFVIAVAISSVFMFKGEDKIPAGDEETNQPVKEETPKPEHNQEKPKPEKEIIQPGREHPKPEPVKEQGVITDKPEKANSGTKDSFAKDSTLLSTYITTFAPKEFMVKTIAGNRFEVAKKDNIVYEFYYKDIDSIDTGGTLISTVSNFKIKGKRYMDSQDFKFSNADGKQRAAVLKLLKKLGDVTPVKPVDSTTGGKTNVTNPESTDSKTNKEGEK